MSKRFSSLRSGCRDLNVSYEKKERKKKEAWREMKPSSNRDMQNIKITTRNFYSICWRSYCSRNRAAYYSQMMPSPRSNRTDGGRRDEVQNLKATDKPDQDKVNPAHLQTLVWTTSYITKQEEQMKSKTQSNRQPRPRKKYILLT
ncbi:hypothetical protein BgiBS90_033067 [Biomphalaria glabrata]|nr:hypothetical protein BgiBS90_033067 [Biomphalaria glabrata]